MKLREIGPFTVGYPPSDGGRKRFFFAKKNQKTLAMPG
jgi:hypothetical protein